VSQIGIVVGLIAESDCLKEIGRTGLASVRCAGADARRAYALASDLAGEGCVALASIGVAGGLDPSLCSGDVVLADGIAGAGGVLRANAVWHARAHSLLQGRTRLIVGTIAGAEAAVGAAETKRRIHRETGAVAVDMESLAVGTAAQALGLPFLAIRVIADTANHRVPAWLPGIIDEAGAVRPAAFCRGVLKRPQDVADIIRLAAANRQALVSLRRVAAFLGSGLGFL